MRLGEIMPNTRSNVTIREYAAQLKAQFPNAAAFNLTVEHGGISYPTAHVVLTPNFYRITRDGEEHFLNNAEQGIVLLHELLHFATQAGSEGGLWDAFGLTAPEGVDFSDWLANGCQ